MSYRLIRPLLFALDAERAHNLSIAALRMMPTPAPLRADPMLETTVAGIRFPNPVGLAAGYDKDGRVAHKMHGLGFGFAELGTLTPLAQPGNPQPRLFRLVEDRAVINRFGFNNGGQGAAADRIARYRRPAGEGPVIGINIGANKDATAAGRGIADYVTGVTCMAPLADYLTVNISSPNTPGLRALQGRAALDDLLGAVMAARGGDTTPIFLKVAPDLEPADVEDIAAACVDHRVDALIVSNTTITRPALRSAHAGEAGGLSGAPLTDLSHARLRDFRRLLGTRLPLIGVGGIATGGQAYARIRAGASLVQLYSALVYEGPYLAKRINAELKALMARDGVSGIADLVGVDA
ncbi:MULTISPECIES: quinone-dependent dihydroorotate dehydrogenase [unclassified Sphingobium]|uniref:quinone-dependent dihydroorotate dehydrogenase n=1 Tax=unclassified Sphingobium TaxID=2611147 RepID=UPI0007F461D7|nr:MULTISPECIES: quinone-dependent dihydroorotate dehydrogenase [unclassified Sphingobium]OAN51987.1 dihydroorotate dehydrogenase (quinone) [Sphingobium sp. TCM1]WIW88298.1 quinone-dependent dihydroorotate dehydrogenase [Sphingobium sp. V4]